MVWACPTQASNGAVRKSLIMQVDGPPRGRGRPKRTWMEVVKIYLTKYENRSDEV